MTRDARSQRLEFEERTTRTLADQDKLLEKVAAKLEAPVLNGGFDALVRKVDKIETYQEQAKESQQKVSKEIGEIHQVIYDPEKGMFVTLRTHDKWITTLSTRMKWFGGLIVAGCVTGVGKLMFDFINGHIHYTP